MNHNWVIQVETSEAYPVDPPTPTSYYLSNYRIFAII